MSQNLPNMLDNTIAKIREMVNVNSVVGEPITTPDGVTIIPISKVSIGLGGGGSDFVSKNVNHHENPFGGGVGAGVKVTPVAFLPLTGSWKWFPIRWISWQPSLIPEWKRKQNNSPISGQSKTR